MSMSTASIRHISINKENPNELASSSCQPIEHLSKDSAPIGKRKALGDVMNTATSRNGIGMTPKGVKTSTNLNAVLNGTPTVHKYNASAKKLITTTTTTSETPNKLLAPTLPPVEKFYPAPPDSFKDIYDENNMRLNDIFINKKVKFGARLPSGSHVTRMDSSEDKFHKFEVESDKLWNKKLKKLTKSMKKKENENCIQIWHDVPNLLSDMPELDLVDSE